jgi:hypothetical protein
MLLAGAPLSAALATEWSIEGRANQRFEFDDNIRLRTTDVETAWGGVFSPEMDLRRRSELWDVTLNTKLAFSRFNDDSLNYEDQFVKLNSGYRTELGTLGLEGKLIRDTTLTSEVTDTGRLDENARRESYNFSPSWSYTLSPRDNFTLSAGWTVVDYHTSSLTDYRFLLGSGSWTRSLTEVHELDATVFTTHYKTIEGDDLERQMYAGEAGLNWIFSERFQARLAGGPRYIRTDVSGSDGDGDFGFILDASASYQFDERTILEAGAARSVEPSGEGTTFERDTLELSVKHDLSPRLLLGLEALYLENEDTGDDRVGDRKYYSIQPRIRWRLAQDWDLTASYRYRAQKSRGSVSWADSNSVLMTVTYRSPKWVLGH